LNSLALNIPFLDPLCIKESMLLLSSPSCVSFYFDGLWFFLLCFTISTQLTSLMSDLIKHGLLLSADDPLLCLPVGIKLLSLVTPFYSKVQVIYSFLFLFKISATKSHYYMSFLLCVSNTIVLVKWWKVLSFTPVIQLFSYLWLNCINGFEA
jgi:hypothetical protein